MKLRSKIQKTLLILSLMTSTSLQAHIYVFDINDTISLLNAIDPEKTHQVVNYQLVAQNLFLKSDDKISLEDHIKKTISDKTEQRLTYGRLPQYARELLEKELITQETFDLIKKLSRQYQQAADVSSSPKNGHLLPSFYRYIDHILATDSNPTIIFQSFGSEIPLALKAVKKRFSGRLKVISEIGKFDDQHQLHFADKIYKTSKDMEETLKPFTVMGWQNKYHSDDANKKMLFFSDNSDAFLKTFFFDDNAHRFAGVSYNGKLLPVEEGLRFAKPYIHQVNTAQALTQDDYFKNLSANQFSALSYNIQLSGLDEPAHLWVDRMIPVLAKLRQADILMLQEVSHSQIIDIQKYLPHYNFVTVNSVTGQSLTVPAKGDQEGMVVGFNKDMFDLTQNSTLWLSDTPHIHDESSKKWGSWDTMFAKLLQRVVLKHRASQAEIVVYNSHFCHEIDPDGIINPRMKSAEMEIDLIKEDIKMGRRVISAGDRNTHSPRDQAVIDLYHQVLDLHDVDETRKGLNTTFIGYEGHPKPNSIKDGKFEYSMNLDKVFYAGQLKLIQANATSGHYNDEGMLDDTGSFEPQDGKRQYASDHAAVMCHFDIMKKDDEI
ncbi:MAG: hypothetical protein ACRYGR_06235 [Janthinobacterium lividum]